MKISELSERTGVSPRLLRYYEQRDLLHPWRLANGYRSYAQNDVERVRQIRNLLAAGLSTEVIRKIVHCLHVPGSGPRPVFHPDLVADLSRELADIEQRIVRLTHNRETIQHYICTMRRYIAEAAEGNVAETDQGEAAV